MSIGPQLPFGIHCRITSGCCPVCVLMQVRRLLGADSRYAVRRPASQAALSSLPAPAAAAGGGLAPHSRGWAHEQARLQQDHHQQQQPQPQQPGLAVDGGPLRTPKGRRPREEVRYRMLGCVASHGRSVMQQEHVGARGNWKEVGMDGMRCVLLCTIRAAGHCRLDAACSALLARNGCVCLDPK